MSEVQETGTSRKLKPNRFRIASIIIAVAIVGIMIVSGFSIFIDRTSSTNNSASPIQAHVMTTPTIALSVYKPSWAGGCVALSVTFSPFAYSLYFYLTVNNHTGVAQFNTLSWANATVTQEAHSNSWYVNRSDGNYKAVFTFNYNIDATGAYVLNVYGNQTSVSDEMLYNVTTLVIYTNAGSGIDATWYHTVYNNYVWDLSLATYYAIADSTAGRKYLRFTDGEWLVATANTNQAQYTSHPYQGSIDDTGFAFLSASGQVHDHFLRLSMKMFAPNPYPETAPGLLMLSSWNNADAMIPVFNNETIYQRAAEAGLKYVLLPEYWFLAGTYEPYNVAVANAISDIQGFCHKYNLKVMVYFGWHDWTSDGVFAPILDYNMTNLNKMLSAWTNFAARWSSSVDAYYVDYASLSLRGLYRNWSWYNYYYLDGIFKQMIATGKTVILNARTDCWWVGPGFIPLKFESMSIETFTTSYAHAILGDPCIHTMNYSAYFYTLSPSYHTGSSWVIYNSTAALKATKYCYDWGMTPVIGYHYGDQLGFDPYMNYFEGWIGGLARTGLVVGTTGSSGIFENGSSVLICQENTGLGTITPTGIAPLSISLANINGTSSNIGILNGRTNVYWVIEGASQEVNSTRVMLNLSTGKIYQETSLLVLLNMGSVNIILQSWLPQSTTGTVATWTMTGSSGTTATFTLSGLESGRMYRLYIDGERISTLTASWSGTISFTYSGPWSEHEFEIVATSVTGSIGPLVDLILLFFALGVVIAPIAWVVKLTKSNKIPTIGQVINMVIFIIIGLASIGIVYTIV